VPKILLAAEIA